MAQSYIKRCVPLMCKLFIFLDVDKKQFHYLFFLRFIVNAFFLYSTTVCLGDRKGYVSKLHDSSYLLTLLLHELSFFINKDRFITIVGSIMEQYTFDEKDPVPAKTVQRYYSEAWFLSKAMLVCCIGGSLLFYMIFSIFLYHTTFKEGGKCMHLTMGWVQETELYLYLLILNAVGAFSILSSAFQWYIVMSCMTVKIKCEFKLLRADLEAGIELDEQEVSSETNPSALARKLEEELGIRANRTSNDPCTNEDGKIIKFGYAEASKFISCDIVNTEAAVNLYHRRYLREKIIDNRIKIHFKRWVAKHHKIIEYVKLTNKTFRLSTLFSIQLGALIEALLIGNLTSIDKLFKSEYVVHVIEVLQIFGCVGLFSYLGQIILNESELLRQVVYNTDWTDKPRGFKRGLLIMQTVATKPLRLTIGGMYTLGMESFANMVNAVYSYTSLIQSLNHE